VVFKWGDSPQYCQLPLPPPPTPSQRRVNLLAVAIHPLVRARAAGKHCTIAGTEPPHFPGVDGVGRQLDDDGKYMGMVYFSTLNSPRGSLAQFLNVDRQDIFPLPDTADGVTIATSVNAAMSSWFALTLRAALPSPCSFEVCILGSTGLSGRIAAPIARHLGATRVVCVGRNRAVLEEQLSTGLADAIIVLEGPIEQVSFAEAANVDVVLDYLWGPPTRQAMQSVLSQRKNHTQRLTWVQIGSVANPETEVSAPNLRMSNMCIIGSGIGSWSQDEMRTEMPKLLNFLVENKDEKPSFKVRRLDMVEEAWDLNRPVGDRVVFTNTSVY